MIRFRMTRLGHLLRRDHGFARGVLTLWLFTLLGCNPSCDVDTLNKKGASSSNSETTPSVLTDGEAFIDQSRDYFLGFDRPLLQHLQLPKGKGPVIVVVVDALRPDHLNAYGYSKNTSPFIEHLADDGLTFTNAFVNGNWTRPSTASLMTGLLPSEHCVERDHDSLSKDSHTFAKILSEKGVATGAVVGNGNASSAFGLLQGFEWVADTTDHWRGLPKADEVFELGLEFVKGQVEKANDSFFLLLFLVDPHDPYRAPDAFERQFMRPELEGVALTQTPHWELSKLNAKEKERVLATYDGAIRYTDEAFERFVKGLKKFGVYDDATIVLTADHGEAFGEHGVYLHSHHFFDEIIRVPLVIRSPGLAEEFKGKALVHLVQWVDLYPTFLEWFGVGDLGAANSLSGRRSLSDLLAQRPTPRPILTEFHNFGINRRSIRTDRWKLTHELAADAQIFGRTVGRRDLLPSVIFEGERWELTDLSIDPFERARRVLNQPTSAFKAGFEVLESMKQVRCMHASTSAVIDASTLDSLEALGYIGGQGSDIQRRIDP